MKKLLLLSLLVAFKITAHSQGIIFKIKYLPNRNYNVALNMDMNMSMDIKGTDAEMQKIKDKGVKLPMQMASKTVMGASIKTGTMTKEDYFPLVITYDNVSSEKTVNGTAAPSQPSPLNGLSMICQYTKEGKISVDSVPGKPINDQLREVLTKSITSFVNQIHFPEKPLSVGDTCSQQIPFTIPIPGVTMQMNVKAQYKLVSINNNLANFDVIETLDMDMDTEQEGKKMIMKGSGKGAGNMVYDIKENMATNTKIDFTMNYKMLVGDMTMLGDAVISTTHITTVTDK